MSELRDMIEADLFAGRRMSVFPLRLLKVLLLGHGQRGCIAWLRIAQACDRHSPRWLAHWIAAMIERRYGCYIHLSALIGPGLKLPHPIGIVIGEGVVIGARGPIYQHVTLGGRRVGDGREGKYPRLADDVVAFAGAAIIGAVSVGDRAVVGANAVVIADVPPDSVAVGVPARLRDNPGPKLVASSA